MGRGLNMSILDLSNPIINIYPLELTQLESIKPKKKKINDKIFTQYPHTLLKRIFKQQYPIIEIVKHSIPDKSRHKIVILPLSCNFISQLILKKFRRKHISILPITHYVFFNHHIVISKFMFKVLMVRVVTKPNWKVLLIINSENNPIRIAIIHKDHNTYDELILPPQSMLLFLHTFSKKDPFVQFILTKQKAIIEKKRQVGAIVWQLKQLAVIDSNYSYIPIDQVEKIKKRLKKVNSKLRNRIIKHFSKFYSNS